MPNNAYVETISSYRLRYGTEDLMQRDVARVLAAEKIDAYREHVLGAGDRVDFFLPETGTAVECKIQGTLTDVLLQLDRYAAHEAVRDIVLVTTRPAHRAIHEVRGKPVSVVYAARSI